MASGGTATHWEAPQFSFNAPDQTQEWKNFYTRVLDFLETLNIDPERQDESKCGWKQIKMMFQGDDRQTLQIMSDNNIITPEHLQELSNRPVMYKRWENIFGTLQTR